MADEDTEEERRKKRLTLDEEIARKYDSDDLKKMVVERAGRGERLDLATRSQVERMLPGHDFSKVRVFRGQLAEEITARHQADAVTVANTGMILVRQSPRSAPGTTSGQALLAHELTHVAQAQKGMHFALEQGSGESHHEKEAEKIEAAAARGHAHVRLSDAQEGGSRLERFGPRVVERCIEMLAERDQIKKERHG